MEETGISGRVAVVTGAAGDIGAAVAHRLAEYGARVAVWDIDAEGLSAVAAKMVAGGAEARAYPVDVRDSRAVDEGVDRVEREMGPIHLLVNVAGILRSAPVTELTDETWADVLAVNLNGVLHCSRAVARRMTTRRSGAIVTVASNAGALARLNIAAYSASKAGAVALTKCLGLELAGHGIRCNIVSPGSTDTGMLRALLQDGDDTSRAISGSLDDYRVGIPLGKVADPRDVADAVVFMASRQASHLTMQEIFVDGGATLGI